MNTLFERDHGIESASRRLELILWALVLLLATALRAWPIPARLPYLAYIDEGHVLHVVERLLVAGGWDTHDYAYPSLPSYLIAALLHLERGISDVAGRPIWSRATLIDYRAGKDFYDLVTPAVIVAGRVVICAVSVVTVLLAGMLARRIAGARAGLITGLFAALCPALALRGSIVIVDTVAALPVLLTLLVARRFLSLEGDRGSGLVFLGGLTSGLALASKYTVGAVFVSVLVAIALRREPPSRRISAIALAGFGLAAGAIAAMPAFLLRHREVLERLRWQRMVYATTHSERGYLGQAVLPEELGWPLAFAGALGLVAMVRRSKTRPIALAWTAFGGCLFLVLAPQPFQPFRNLVPVVPLWCVSAAVLFSGTATRRNLWIDVLGLLVAAAVALSLLAGLRGGFTDRISRPDSRSQLVDWLALHTSPGDRVLVVEELVFARSELDRVRAAMQVLPWQAAVEATRRDRPRFVVGGTMALTDADRAAWEPVERTWRSWVAAQRIVATFGRRPTPVFRGFWRDNDELLLVLEPQTEPAVATRAGTGPVR